MVAFQLFFVCLFCILGALFLLASITSPQRRRHSSILAPEPQSLLRTKLPTPVIVRYQKPSKVYQRNEFTLSDFFVNGANLASYGFEDKTNGLDAEIALTHHFGLFGDFDISQQGLKGDEDWEDLVSMHGEMLSPALPFYMDKIASKRWMLEVGIPIPKPFMLKYVHEFRVPKKKHEAAIERLLPDTGGFVIKPSHLTLNKGVWLVRHDKEMGQHTMGYRDSTNGSDFRKRILAHLVNEKLAESVDGEVESRALAKVHPGFVIEERITTPDGPATEPAMEFQVYTIWGRVYIANWVKGRHSKNRLGLVYRDGSIVDWSGKKEEELPDWVNWNRILEIAERLGRHKDFFRVDMFVGLPDGHPALQEWISKEEKYTAVEIRVSEMDIYPKLELKDKRILEEAARLWMAGYKMGIYKTISNTEVPKAFSTRGWLQDPKKHDIEIPHAEGWEHDEREDFLEEVRRLKMKERLNKDKERSSDSETEEEVEDEEEFRKDEKFLEIKTNRRRLE